MKDMTSCYNKLLLGIYGRELVAVPNSGEISGSSGSNSLNLHRGQSGEFCKHFTRQLQRLPTLTERHDRGFPVN